MATRHTRSDSRINRSVPPVWLERSLLLLLPARDRESITGDLHETYCEDKLPRTGRLQANLWYLRQVLSLMPRALLFGPTPRVALALICLFTALCALWLGVVGLLHHPGYTRGEGISCIILTQSVLSLSALRLRRLPALRFLALSGCLPILWLALTAFRGALHDPAHFEGYILLIALALVVQAVLTLLTLSRPPHTPVLSPNRL